MKGNSCSAIDIPAGGRHIFVGNRGHDSIAGFSIDQSTVSGNTADVVAGIAAQSALNASDSVDIIAETPTGLSDSSRLAFAPPAGQLILFSGDNQSIVAGTQAALPLVVQVREGGAGV